MSVQVRDAAGWRAVQSALLADVEAWQALAEKADEQPGIPPLIAVDYGIAVREACLKAASAAQTAADMAGLYAGEIESAVAS